MSEFNTAESKDNNKIKRGARSLLRDFAVIVGIAFVFAFAACDFLLDDDTNGKGIVENLPPVGSYVHTTPDGRTMTIYYVLPTNVNNDTKVIFSMHGTDRNADSYIVSSRPLSIIGNFAVIAPQFSLANFPWSAYQMINISVTSGNVNQYSEWSFNHIDRIFDEFVEKFELSAATYILTGHSAGGQFTHRSLMFSKSPKLDYAIAANAGTYTFLNEGSTNTDWNYGRGIRNLSSLKEDLLHNLANKKLHILIGSLDNDPNAANFDRGIWDVQGISRYERAYNFFDAAQKFAIENNVNFNWELTVMDGVGHNTSRTMPYIADIITKDTRPAILAAAANLSGQERIYGTWYSSGNSVYVITKDTVTYVYNSEYFVVSINSFTADTNVETVNPALYPNGYRIRGVYTETNQSSTSVGDSFDRRFYPAADNSSIVRRGSTNVWNRYR